LSAPASQSDSTNYELRDTVIALRRYWWLVVLAPVLVGVALTVRNLRADYQASFSASVLLPGDTEIPGSAERPELMILDDIGPVVGSAAFAQLVATEADLPMANVHLTASRYSRVVTVTAKSGDKQQAEAMAVAAAAVFPAAVNTFMVAEGAPKATVMILDAPAAAQRGDANQWTIALIATAVALAIGCFLALVLDALLTTMRQTDGSGSRETSIH